MTRYSLFFLILFIISSCSSPETSPAEVKTDLRDQLVGEWNNISLRVDVHVKDSAEPVQKIIVEPGEWEKKLSIKPVRTFFNQDSTWHSAHYKLNDSLFYDPSGRWWVEGTKLIMLQQKPRTDTTTLTVIIKNDTATFEGMVDMDEEGVRNDKYYGRQVKRPG